MKNGDIVYFVDRKAKFYFDMKLIEKIHKKEYNTNVYKCEILMNKYKFNDKTFKENFDLRGKIDCYSILSLVDNIQEAEEAIK